MAEYRVFCGTFINTTEDNPVLVCENTVIGVKGKKIIFISQKDELEELLKEYSISPKVVEHLSKSEFMIPGFVDTHAHAPQYCNVGKGLGCQLLDWLRTYTYPTESKFSNINFAEMVYKRCVTRLLKNGTTTSCYYATYHTPPSISLCKIIDNIGQRAYVGKVNVDQNVPDYCTETTTESLSETHRFIDVVNGMNNEFITPCVTPRFALSCTMELMRNLGEIARQYQLPIQTHLAECLSECRAVKAFYPDSLNITDVYNRAGLLSDKTILAHSIYLSDNEIDILQSNGCGISHCPNSNTSLLSGFMDSRKILEKGVKLGLGTDISGGYAVSMLDSIRQAVGVSNTHSILAENNDTFYQPIGYGEAFRMATLGGSQVLGLDDVTGNFEVSKDFDALLIDTQCENSPFDIFDDDTTEDIFQKFIFTGDDRNIKKVYVGGRQVV